MQRQREIVIYKTFNEILNLKNNRRKKHIEKGGYYGIVGKSGILQYLACTVMSEDYNDEITS